MTEKEWIRHLKAVDLLWLFIIGTVITYALAFVLFEDHHPIEAAEVIIISPFPCPTGLPC